METLATVRHTTWYQTLKEILIYTVAAFSSLTILGYTVHMFIGGLVSKETEILAITIACLIGASIIGLMAWDVIRRRKDLDQ